MLKAIGELKLTNLGKNANKSLVSKGELSRKCSNAIYRMRDLVMSIIALILLSPVILVVSLAIYITSGRPILFCQKRPGKDGRLFFVYKFRTMCNGAENILKKDRELYRKYLENNCKLKPEDDPRIGKLGLFLRKSSMDELPQLLNVIKGDMSIVGPRPVLPEQVEQYGEDVNEFLSVRPGITGLWQVMGRSEIPYPERKYIDLAYIRNRTLLLDFKIILKTFKAVFAMKGAY
ncbi:sugar transferase [Candidatus Poribacteria bacterium]|nr:sugar transferase [Candidatus Poribacteria bacterium]